MCEHKTDSEVAKQQKPNENSTAANFEIKDENRAKTERKRFKIINDKISNRKQNEMNTLRKW